MNWFNGVTLSLALTLSLGSLKFMYEYGVEVGTTKSDQIIEAYKEKINSLQDKIKKNQENIKVQVVTEYKDKVKVIVKKEKEYVYQATNDVPAQYTLSSGWVYLHDISATGGDYNSSFGTISSPSGIEDNQALRVIVENYGICRQNAQQLKSLQEFILKSSEVKN
jgi:hypothetical protein